MTAFDAFNRLGLNENIKNRWQSSNLDQAESCSLIRLKTCQLRGFCTFSSVFKSMKNKSDKRKLKKDFKENENITYYLKNGAKQTFLS